MSFFIRGHNSFKKILLPTAENCTLEQYKELSSESSTQTVVVQSHVADLWKLMPLNDKTADESV